MSKVSPAEFVRQVRQEVGRVTWPTRKEVAISATMVFVMVLIASLFFMLVDALLGMAIEKILGY